MGSEGLSIYASYKEHKETSSHLLLHCHFSKELWAISSHLYSSDLVWEGLCFSSELRLWLQKASTIDKGFPLELAWTIWLMRNKAIFNDRTQNLYASKSITHPSMD